MKTSLLILTVVYFLAFLNFLYGLILRIYVHFANMNLGHNDAFFEDISNTWHLVLSIVFGLFAFGSFKSYQSPKPQPWLKWLVFFPIALLALYVLWGITILISSGGKWN